ncbi:hypothetical protein Q5P01_019308 [Channa striata]|uniref:Uncharacterized protein n=1 Tax=Channa striata TaxID=64152 RepID=A0AA88M154_CHASR|nr:hypothetical protein Q5P01_019308 [Channa striata]
MRENLVKLKSLIAHYDPFTRVHGETEHGFPAIPPLEPSLASILFPKPLFFVSSIILPMELAKEIGKALAAVLTLSSEQLKRQLNECRGSPHRAPHLQGHCTPKTPGAIAETSALSRDALQPLLPLPRNLHHCLGHPNHFRWQRSTVHQLRGDRLIHGQNSLPPPSKQGHNDWMQETSVCPRKLLQTMAEPSTTG